MSKSIHLTRLSHTIDRERDFDNYELSVPRSVFDQQPAYRYRVYNLGNLRTTTTICSGLDLLTPNLANLAELRDLFVVAVWNEHRDQQLGGMFKDVIIGFFEGPGCYIYFGGDKFTLRNTNEVARIMIYGSGPYYKISVRNAKIFDVTPHKCQFDKYDNDIGISYTDSAGIDKLADFLENL